MNYLSNKPTATTERATRKLRDMSSPLAFRPPLLSQARGTMQIHGYYDSTILRPLLYRMFAACHILRLGTVPRFTALVLLHRYSHAVTMKPDHKEDLFELKWVAAACLFLACKAEEEPRRLRDVINLAHMIFGDQQSKSSTPASSSTKQDESSLLPYEILNIRMNPPDLDEAYWQAKKKIVAAEQTVLRWLAFDVSVSHPHRAVRFLLEHLFPPSLTTAATILLRRHLQPIAFRRLNDALFYAPALCHNVLELACAAVVLAIEEVEASTPSVSDIPASTQDFSSLLAQSLGPTHWWSAYQVSDEALQSTKEDLQRACDILKTNH